MNNMYRAAFYNPKLKVATEVFIDYKQEIDYISGLLDCVDIDLISYNNKFLIAYDVNGFNKIGNLLSNMKGIQLPLPGPFIIVGNLDEQGFMSELSGDISIEWLNEIIKPFAKITNI